MINRITVTIFLTIGLMSFKQCGRNNNVTNGISPGNTTYYIDPVKGNDNKSGLKENRAWRSFSNVNAMALSPGDRIEIVKPGKFDHSMILQGGGTVDNPVEVNFAGGRYDLFTKNITRKTYNISNTNAEPDSLKAVGILLEKARNINISGPGAEMTYRGKMIEVCIDSCENITISDLQFDYERPTVSEYKVIKAGDDYVELKIHGDSKYKIEDGIINWIGEGWSYSENMLGQELNPETDHVRRKRNPLKDLTFEEIRPFYVRGTGSHSMKVNYIYQLRNPYRDYAAVFTRRSKNITWKNVQFHFLHGMGMVSQFSENLTFDSVFVAPKENSGRTTAAWADCMHFSGCKGKILVQNCTFVGAHDDAINVHGTHMRVIKKISRKLIKVKFIHRQTYGFLAFNDGDEIEFIRKESLEGYGTNVVKHANMLNEMEILLELYDPLPEDLKIDDVVENVTWTPEVEIRGCKVRRIPTRGFLLTTRKKVVVEENHFHRTHMAAILVADDASSWFESGYVRDLTILKNTFFKCDEPVIFIHPENTVSNPAVHKNIQILNNKFDLLNDFVVGAKSTTNLLVTGNTITAEKLLSDKVIVRTTDCKEVVVRDNIYEIR